ncbi:hypothetical protein Ancab_021806 [Ancistrocladus abbreviatus]
MTSVYVGNRIAEICSPLLQFLKEVENLELFTAVIEDIVYLDDSGGASTPSVRGINEADQSWGLVKFVEFTMYVVARRRSRKSHMDGGKRRGGHGGEAELWKEGGGGRGRLFKFFVICDF